MSQPENEKVYSLANYVAVCSETTDWFMYVMSEINDPSKEVKVRFVKKSEQCTLLSKMLEKCSSKLAIFHRCSIPYHTIHCDTIDIKNICDKIKTLDRDFKMDLNICKSQLK